MLYVLKSYLVCRHMQGFSCPLSHWYFKRDTSHCQEPLQNPSTRSKSVQPISSVSASALTSKKKTHLFWRYSLDYLIAKTFCRSWGALLLNCYNSVYLIFQGGKKLAQGSGQTSLGWLQQACTPRPRLQGCV